MNIKGKTETAVDIRVDMKKLNVKSVPSGVAQRVRRTGDRITGFEILVREENLRGYGLSYRQVITYSYNCLSLPISTAL